MTWWMWPSRLTLFFLIPVYALCVYANPAYLIDLGVRGYFLTDHTRLLGAMSLVLFSLGAFCAEQAGLRHFSGATSVPLFDDGKITLLSFAILMAGALLGYALLLVPSLAHPGEIVARLTGGYEALLSTRSYIRGSAIAGSSLMGLQGLAAAVWIVGRSLHPRLFRTPSIAFFAALLGILCVFRVVLLSERLALVELLLPATVARLYLIKSRAVWVRLSIAAFPLLATLGLIALFGAFEYLRSWSVYQYRGIGFVDFTIQRFAGYYLTALNNGALMFERVRSPGPGALSFSVLYDLPGINRLLATGPPESGWTTYLGKFASQQFNNPSGVFPVLTDFGAYMGMAVLAGCGAVLGYLAAGFSRHMGAYLAIFPVFFIGNWELLRVFYWGDSRFLLIAIASIILIVVSGQAAASRRLGMYARKTGRGEFGPR